MLLTSFSSSKTYNYQEDVLSKIEVVKRIIANIDKNKPLEYLILK